MTRPPTKNTSPHQNDHQHTKGQVNVSTQDAVGMSNIVGENPSDTRQINNLTAPQGMVVMLPRV